MTSSAPVRPSGPDVDFSQIKPGDWAYVYGYWWKIHAIWTGTGVQNIVALEGRDGRQGVEAHIAHVTRWRKA